MKGIKILAMTGLTVSLLLSNVTGPMAVMAADGCGHGNIQETTSVLSKRAEPHTYSDANGKEGKCTITYTTYQRVAVCGTCGQYLGRSVYETYEHSVKHD